MCWPCVQSACPCVYIGLEYKLMESGARLIEVSVKRELTVCGTVTEAVLETVV